MASDIPPDIRPGPAIDIPPEPLEPRPVWWGLIEELPYAAIIVLTLIGVSWESISNAPKTTYWEYVTPIIGVICIVAGWRHTREQRADRHGRDPGPAMGGGADRDVSDQ